MSVKVYSSPGCPWCAKAKDFLGKHNVKFTDIDVSKDAKKGEEMIEKSGQTGTPVIDVNGEIIVGFDEAKLKEKLKIK